MCGRSDSPKNSAIAQSDLVGQREHIGISWDTSGLSSRGRAGGAIVGEKLLMNLCNERLNISCYQKKTNLQFNSGGWCRADVSGLADLASCFVLPCCVEVAEALDEQ